MTGIIWIPALTPEFPAPRYPCHPALQYRANILNVSIIVDFRWKVMVEIHKLKFLPEFVDTCTLTVIAEWNKKITAISRNFVSIFFICNRCIIYCINCVNGQIVNIVLLTSLFMQFHNQSLKQGKIIQLTMGIIFLLCNFHESLYNVDNIILDCETLPQVLLHGLTRFIDIWLY